jgi:hypothetical protein
MIGCSADLFDQNKNTRCRLLNVIAPRHLFINSGIVDQEPRSAGRGMGRGLTMI